MKNIRLRSYKDIGSILVADGTLPAERLKEAQEVHAATGMPLGKTLVELEFITEWDLARAIAKELGVPFVRLKPTAAHGEALRKLDAATMHRNRLFCLESFDGVDSLVIAEPPTVDVMSEISPYLANKVFLMVALITDVEAVLTNHVPLPTENRKDASADVPAEDILKGFGD